MARIKRAQIRKTRTRKLFKRAKGFHLARSKTRRQTMEAVLHAKADAFEGRKQRKRQFRALWIQRISAALMQHPLSYSRFMHGLKLAGIELNRKQLSELAIHQPEAFGSLVVQAGAAIDGSTAG
ncbi:MAG: 50S ribosomal protein L20 [Oligoflexia bacterium]|nr:50S ribosomal protein L20 [Oligoflexia bacterium]